MDSSAKDPESVPLILDAPVRTRPATYGAEKLPSSSASQGSSHRGAGPVWLQRLWVRLDQTFDVCLMPQVLLILVVLCAFLVIWWSDILGIFVNNASRIPDTAAGLLVAPGSVLRGGHNDPESSRRHLDTGPGQRERIPGQNSGRPWIATAWDTNRKIDMNNRPNSGGAGFNSDSEDGGVSRTRTKQRDTWLDANLERLFQSKETDPMS